MRSRERLAAMAERSKTSLEETQEKVAALAAQGRTSIEESRSRGLGRLAALAQQQPKPVRPIFTLSDPKPYTHVCIEPCRDCPIAGLCHVRFSGFFAALHDIEMLIRGEYPAYMRQTNCDPHCGHRLLACCVQIGQK